MCVGGRGGGGVWQQRARITGPRDDCGSLQVVKEQLQVCLPVCLSVGLPVCLSAYVISPEAPPPGASSVGGGGGGVLQLGLLSGVVLLYCP